MSASVLLRCLSLAREPPYIPFSVGNDEGTGALIYPLRDYKDPNSLIPYEEAAR